MSTLISELQAARHKALLISPYFVPGNEGLDGFSAMAGRGVQVGVVTNSLAANDVAAVHGATWATACRCWKPASTCTS